MRRIQDDLKDWQAACNRVARDELPEREAAHLLDAMAALEERLINEPAEGLVDVRAKLALARERFAIFRGDDPPETQEERLIASVLSDLERIGTTVLPNETHDHLIGNRGKPVPRGEVRYIGNVRD